MIVVKRIQTKDGVLHPHYSAAERHAEEMYGKAITAMAHKVARVEKYKDAIDFVEQAIDSFVELKALRDDLKLIDDSEED